MSHWVRFCSACPIANCSEPNRVCYWKHGDDNYEQDINEDGYVRCRRSGCQMNKYPCFILYLLFKCRNHPNYQSVTKMEIFHALSIVSSGDLGLYESEVKTLLQKILTY